MPTAPALSADGGMSAQGDNHSRENKALGISLALANMALLAVMSAIVKWLGQDYHVFQITFFRNICSFLVVLPMVWYMGGISAIKTKKPKFHIFRGVFGVTAMLLLFSSYTLLPLADATALGFTAPLFLTVLSWPLLGERVGRLRWAAVLIGFAGAVIMARPTGDATWFGIGVALAAAFMVSMVMVMVRRMNNTENPVAIIFYFTVTATVVTSMLVPFVWKTPDMAGLGLMTLLGVIGGVNQMLLTLAYRFAPAVLVVSFNYTSIIWASILGYLIWADVPGWHVIAGATVVMASGMFITFREIQIGRRFRKRIPPA